MQFVGFSAKPEDARAACDVAYGDIKRAFAIFLRHNQDRPFFIASHSQGTLHAMRLIEEFVDKDPCVARCVACYLLGMGIPRNKFDAGQAFRTLHPCMSPTDLQAVIAWQLRTFETTEGEADYLVEGYGPGFWHTGDRWQGHAGELLMTNPLTWSSQQGNDSATSQEVEPHKGIGIGVFEPPFNPMAVQSGKPMDSRLQRIRRKFPKPAREPLSCKVTRSEVVVRGLPEWMSTTHFGTGVGDLHIFDYSYFFYNLRDNITERLVAYEQAQGRPPWRGFLPAKL